MCHFITLGVREAGVAILDEEKGRWYGLGVAPAQNPHLTALFPAGDKLFWITLGGCSCGLCVWAGDPDADERARAKERARYRKKGWSEAKVNRAIEAKHAGHRVVARGQREDSPPERLGDLLGRLTGVRGGVRIFVHEYGGAVDDEVVTGRQGQPMSVHAVMERGLPEDLVVDVIDDASER